MGRTEPDLPSIHVPLEHETAIAAQPDRLARQPQSILQEEHASNSRLQEPDPIPEERLAMSEPQRAEIQANQRWPAEHLTTPRTAELLANGHEEPLQRETAITDYGEEDVPDSRLRRWPHTRYSDRSTLGSDEVTLDEHERGRPNRWEA